MIKITVEVEVISHTGRYPDKETACDALLKQIESDSPIVSINLPEGKFEGHRISFLVDNIEAK